jgi:hypothetical protein
MLPELPEPAYSGAYLLPAWKLPPVYTEAQMLAYRDAVVEACAVICAEIYHKHIGPEYGEVRYGIAHCADAIRSLIDAPSEPAHTDHPARHYDRTCPACNVQSEPKADFENFNTFVNKNYDYHGGGIYTEKETP